MDVAVVGAGIVGLAVARRVLEVRPDARVTVLDKEQVVGAHQTSHNSGVVHAGLSYVPGSLKARLCRRGAGLLKEYCVQRGIPYDECGKLVVARDATEIGRLDALQERATANGVPLARLGPQALREVEPHVTGVAAVHSPTTAIVDFGAVARSFADDVRAAGGVVLLGNDVEAVRRRGAKVCVLAREGGSLQAFEVDRLVVCAGLQSDRVARLAGGEAEPAIVPFRGEYYRLVPSARRLVRALVYPVPDPRLPFLGIHLTRRIDGEVDLGPNAVLALAREGYRRRDVRAADLVATARWPGTWALARTHWRTGVKELHGSLSRRAFVAEAASFVPELTVADVVPGPAGVRAQAVDRNGALVDDFRIGLLGPVVTLRNAPSPAATSSLAIAEHVVDQLLATRS